MQPRVVILLYLLLLTAGCNGLLDQGEQRTLTPAPVPPQPTPTEDPRVGVAPGVSTTAVTDVDFLAERHSAFLGTTSYVWTESWREYSIEGNQTVLVSRSETRVVANATGHVRETTYERLTTDGEIVDGYELGDYSAGTERYAMWRPLPGGEREYLSSKNVALASDFGRKSGDAMGRYLRLDAATVSRLPSGQVARFLVAGTPEEHPTYGPVEDYRVHAVVREDGFVTDLNASFSLPENTQGDRIEYEFSYSRVGSATPTPPPWLEAAREAVGPTSGGGQAP